MQKKGTQIITPDIPFTYGKVSGVAAGRVLVLIQVGGKADEGGCAALVTLGAARLGRRDKHTPPQSKQSVNGKQVRGGQGAPLIRLRCPVVPAARKLVFMPPLLLLVFGVVAWLVRFDL